MTVNEKVAISPALAVGFKHFFNGQTQNYLDKLKTIGWNSSDITCKNEVTFSPTGLASQVLYVSLMMQNIFGNCSLTKKELETIQTEFRILQKWQNEATDTYQK